VQSELFGQTDKKSKIVLGLDDAVDNLVLLKAAIEADGYTFIGAQSGGECLALLGKIVPRFILLDVQMPGLDGFETCRRLRRMQGLHDVPVAFVTTRKTATDVKTAIAVGGNDFIAKPYEVPTLRERTRYWTARKAPPRLIGFE
jgi:CheY-like chemotaxis protein